MREVDVQPSRPEAPTEREKRVWREAALIAKAEGDIAAGLGLDHEDVESWLDALDRGEIPPLPRRRGIIPP